MQKSKGVWRSVLSNGALALSLGVVSAAAHADRFGLQIAGGVADRDIKKADLAVVWDPNLTWWEIGGFHFTLTDAGVMC